MIKIPVGATAILALALTTVPALARRSPVVQISPANMQALAPRLAQARVRTLRAHRTFYGAFTLPPGAKAVVTPRIRGRVTALYATIGSYVHRGAPLARVQSLLVGNPPASVLVHAPMSGVVDTRPAILGEAVGPGTALYYLIKPDRLWLKAYVYQKDIASVRVGQKASIRALGVAARLRGRVVMMAPHIDPRRGAQTIWLSLAATPPTLKPALFARARIIVGIARTVAVPRAAIVDANGRTAVFVATAPGRFRYTPIGVGLCEHGYCGVSGLKAGARVVTQGNAELYTLWLTGGKLKADS
ncbi:MAG: efflux RND transporter periplasmic adaptor subunit [Acidiferrobacter sp.]